MQKGQGAASKRKGNIKTRVSVEIKKTHRDVTNGRESSSRIYAFRIVAQKEVDGIRGQRRNDDGSKLRPTRSRQ